MLLSAMSILVVAQSSSEIPEGLMNNPVHTLTFLCLIAFFLREIDANCVLLVCHTASNGNSLPTFRNNLSVPFQVSKMGPIGSLKKGPMGCPETSLKPRRTLFSSPALFDFELKGFRMCPGPDFTYLCLHFPARTEDN